MGKSIPLVLTHTYPIASNIRKLAKVYASGTSSAFL